MRFQRTSINRRLDGRCHHVARLSDAELPCRAREMLARADALTFGRVTCETMEARWWVPVRTWIAGLPRPLDLALANGQEQGSGAMAMRDVPRR